MKIEFLGGFASVGASSITIKSKSSILLDYGTKVHEVPPKFPLELNEKIEAVLLTHCHLDHSGALPLLFKEQRVPIYSVSPTKELSEVLWLDSIKVSKEEGYSLPFDKKEIEITLNFFKEVEYNQNIKIKEFEFKFLDAGHIPGSCFSLIKAEDKTLLYTGDFNDMDTNLIKGCEKKIERTDILITESTYADRDHPDRRSQEKELLETIRETLANDGIVLLPTFAVSRAQEILLTLYKNKIDYPLFMDGMCKITTTIINNHSYRLKQKNILDRALRKVVYIKNLKERKRAIKNPCVIITSSGMLQGGPLIWYIKRLYNREECSLLITGFQMDGTPGKILLESGRYINKGLNLKVKMRVKRLDFSSHVGRKGLFNFINKLNPEKIFCVHGDHTLEFAEELKELGFEAIAPLANNRIFYL